MFDKNNFIALMNYKKPTNIGYSFDNYDKIKNLLFNSDEFINASELNNNIIKINHLVLIKHEIYSPMFHMFPKNVVNKILYKINNDSNNSNDNDNFNKNVFITRGKALHMPRNLDNQEEIEQHFLSINYNVINPEIMDIEQFIKNIQNANNIFITWGGAMVNLCYVNSNVNIYLLQSLSYKDENIFDIFKFLKSYTNLYLIKCNKYNKIDITNDIVNAIKLS